MAKSPYTETYSIHVKYFPIVQENLLMTPNAGRNTFIYVYMKLVTPDGITIHLSMKQCGG